MVAVSLASLCLAGALSGCNDDSGEPVDTVTVQVDTNVDATSPAPVSGSVPPTGLTSIDGPATVDPDFGGADPGDGGG